MAALGAQTVASSYEQLLHVDRDGGGNSTTHVSVKDGDNGTTFGFTIATDALMMTSTNRLEFGDNASYIHQSADGVLDLVSDTEIELTATTIDINGAVDMSSTLAVGDAVTVTKAISGSSGDNFLLNIVGTEASGTDLGVGDNVGILFKTAYETTTSKIGSAIVATRESADDTISSTGLAFKVSQNDETLDTAMTIDSSQRVGIGTTSPGYQLDLRRNDTGTTTSLGIRQLGSGDASMAFQTTTSPYGFCIGVDGSDSDAFKIATGTDDIGTNTKLTITSAGNVGIGTASPLSTMHIAGNLEINSESTSSATADIDKIIFKKQHTSAGSGFYTLGEIRSFTVGGFQGGLDFYTGKNAGGGSYTSTFAMRIHDDQKVGIGTTFGENIASSVNKFAVRSDTTSTHYNMVNIWEHGDTQTGTEQRIGWAFGDDGGSESSFGFAGYVGVGKQDAWNVDSARDSYMSFGVTANNSVAEAMRISSVGGGTGAVLIAKTATGFTNVGFEVDSGGRVGVKTNGSEAMYINRSQDGTLIEFASADTAEGTIAVSGSTVSYNGFSGSHESSGIPTDTAIGTVVSTIDELDVYPDTDYKTGEAHNKAGETRLDHAKIKVSDSVGDKRVYGVLASFNEDNKPIVASVGIGSLKVTGACAGGDLLESNGDGTAKVQDDDIIRSKTIGKVAIGNINTSVKLVSCVLYCG